MRRIAVISIILESPAETQAEFNECVSNFKGIIKGRMGIPFDDIRVGVISLVVVSELDEINAFTGRLGRIAGCTVKTAVSKESLRVEL